MSTVAQLQTDSVTVEAGASVTLPLHVTNTGEVVEDYQVGIVGVPAAWTTVEPSHFTLYPGTDQVATVVLTPPRTAQVPAGQLRFGVHVVPTEHPDQAVVPEAVVEVLPFLDTVAELVPRTSHGRFGGKHQVAIDNRGNTPVSVMLIPAVDSDALTVAPQPESLTVEPGMASFADVRVRTTNRMWRGKPRTLPFGLIVAPQGGQEVRLDGGHVQDPILPPWFLKALLALLALILLLIAFWQLALRPVIQSAAQDAVAEQVADAENHAAAAEEAAQQAGQARTEAEEIVQAVTPTETPGPGSIPQAGPVMLTEPASGRLLVVTPPGLQRIDSYHVEGGQRFALTDFVLENTQGDSGVLTIRLGSRVVLTQALESFRTTDYHFVTPFVATGPIDLQLVVRCNRPGTPPDTDPAPTSCRNAVTFGGQLTAPAP